MSVPKVCFCFCLFFSVMTFGQDAPVFRTDTTVVTVPTLVVQSNGELLYGLQARDFVIRDNGEIQTTRMDETMDADPVSLVIVLQTGHRALHTLESDACRTKPFDDFSSVPKGHCISALRSIGLMLETFLHTPGSELAIVTFDSHATLRQDFTADVSSISDKMKNLPEGDGSDAILDALNTSLQMLDKRPAHQRKIILLVSEMLDNGSTTLTYEQAARRITDTNTEFYTVTFQESSDEAQKAMQTGLSMMGLIPGGGGGINGLHDNAPDGGMGGVGGSIPGGTGGRMATGGMGNGISGGMSGGPGGGMGGGMPGGGMGGGMPGGGMGGGPGGGLSRIFGPQGIPWGSMILPLLHLAAEEMKANVPQAIADLTGGEYIIFDSPNSFDSALGMLGNHAHGRYHLSFRPNKATPGAHKIDVSLAEPLTGVFVASRRGYWLRKSDWGASKAASAAPSATTKESLTAPAAATAPAAVPATAIAPAATPVSTGISSDEKR
jgi:hypothetical protein